jgi:hypothetical protein
VTWRVDLESELIRVYEKINEGFTWSCPIKNSSQLKIKYGSKTR